MRENASKLISLFGGVSVLSREIVVDKSVVSRWTADKDHRGTEGSVPTRYNTVIVDAARRLRLDMKKVEACLDLHVCPCCGRALEPGQSVPAA